MDRWPPATLLLLLLLAAPGCGRRSTNRQAPPRPSPQAPLPAAPSAPPMASARPAGRVWAEPLGAPILAPRSEDGHINDHTFVQDPGGRWHFFGIVARNPPVLQPGGAAGLVLDAEERPRPSRREPRESSFGHATSARLASGWRYAERPFLENLPAGGVLWAPHVIRDGATYHMFYCSGGDPHAFAISSRTSPDLVRWSGPSVLFRDGYQGRDPMVLWIEESKEWVLYYTATEQPTAPSHHVVALRRSKDLVRWGEREIAYRDAHVGTSYGPTESPFVVRRGDRYYLFVGPKPYDPPSRGNPNWKHPGYVGTDVLRSSRPDRWSDADLVGHIDAHAPEVIQDSDGRWYVSSAGIQQKGLYLSRLHWEDE